MRPTGRTGGVTFDVGATVSLIPKLSVGVVGTNLRNLHNSHATQGVGYGVAVIPIPDLVIAADGWTRLTPDNFTQRKGTNVMVGGDLTLGGKFGVRAGGGYDSATANGYVAVGRVRRVGDRRHRRGDPPGCLRVRRCPAGHDRGHQPSSVHSGAAAVVTAAGNLMTGALSETVWRPHCAGGEPSRTLRRRTDSAPQSPAPSKRFARARARALGQRTPYTMSLAERLLIARLIERDEQAFSEIVRQYGDKVFSLIYRMLGNRQEAEDVAQEVFITVFKTIDSFRGEAKFSTWLLRIAANHCKNRIKYLARRPTEGGRPRGRLPGAAYRRSAGAARAGPDRRARTSCWRPRRLERLMQEAIADLDRGPAPAGRACATSRSCPTEEIGEITGLPEGTIKSRLHRARMAIKEWLDRHTR